MRSSTVGSGGVFLNSGRRERVGILWVAKKADRVFRQDEGSLVEPALEHVRADVAEDLRERNVDHPLIARCERLENSRSLAMEAGERHFDAGRREAV